MSLYNQDFKKTGWENKDRHFKFNTTVLSPVSRVLGELMGPKMPKNEPQLQNDALKPSFI